MAFKLKLTYGTVTRKLPLDSAPLDWPSLESQIQHRFGFDSDSRLTLSYDDADGDSITINSSAELQETFIGLIQPTSFTVRLLHDNSGPSPIDLTCSTPLPSVTPSLVEESSEADTTNEDDLESLLGANENTDPNEFVVVEREDKGKAATVESQDPPSPVLTATPVTKSTSTPSFTSTEPLLDSPTPADADPPLEELPSGPASLHDLLAAPLDRLKTVLAQRFGDGHDLLANLIDERRRNSFAREIGSEVNDFVAEVINAVRTEARKEARPASEDTEAGPSGVDPTTETSTSDTAGSTQPTSNAAQTETASVAPTSESQVERGGPHSEYRPSVEVPKFPIRFASGRGGGRGRGGLFVSSGSPGRQTAPSVATPAPTPIENPSPPAESSPTVPPPSQAQAAAAPPVIVNATPSYPTQMPGAFDFQPQYSHPSFSPMPLSASNPPSRMHVHGLFGQPSSLFGAPPNYNFSYQPHTPQYHTPNAQRQSYPTHYYGGGSTVSRVGINELRSKLREMGFGHDDFALKIACERVLADDSGAQMEVLVRKVLDLIL